ncbi:MAG: alpha/beta fold hydrolase [Actinomycetota bacterium]|nr:alpha/beta fold hydrolase [Actinomycetota bacterium]
MSVTDVATSLESLPARFKAGSGSVDGRFRINVGSVSRDVVVSADACRVESPNGVVPHVEISTDPTTWRQMDAGRMSGIEAFARKRLTIRGSIEKTLHFEPMFERPDAGAVAHSMRAIRVHGATISTLVAGPVDAPPLVLIHGLGATKASWLTVVPSLAAHHRVVALDLPGFGASSKPLGSYDAKWFAKYVSGLLDALGLQRTFLAGNSMGGRVAMEVAMRHPERVEAIACLCPVAAFTNRPVLLFARLLRPELGLLAGRLPRKRMKEGLRQLFADASCLDEAWYDAAIDDFLQVWKSPRARIAFARSLRNIYLDEPEGEKGFWMRLSRMETPALFIYGKRDVLITHQFGRRIRKTLPSAKVCVWRDCGHVPQIEFPERTARTMVDFFESSASKRAEAG